MHNSNEASQIAADFRQHFDQYYLGVIPRLLNEEGMFLAFVSMLTALEALAGVYAPHLGAGDRFQRFVSAYFPEIYQPLTSKLWKFRNRMIHSFNPGPFMVVCHASRMHLAETGGTPMLNAEDFYSDLLTASRRYFVALYADLELQRLFIQRVGHEDGGTIASQTIAETVVPR